MVSLFPQLLSRNNARIMLYGKLALYCRLAHSIVALFTVSVMSTVSYRCLYPISRTSASIKWFTVRLNQFRPFATSSFDVSGMNLFHVLYCSPLWCTCLNGFLVGHQWNNLEPRSQWAVHTAVMNSMYFDPLGRGIRPLSPGRTSLMYETFSTCFFHVAISVLPISLSGRPCHWGWVGVFGLG